MTSIYIYITNSINFVLILACFKALSKDLTRQANHQINVTINSTTAIVKKQQQSERFCHRTYSEQYITECINKLKSIGIFA